MAVGYEGLCRVMGVMGVKRMGDIEWRWAVTMGRVSRMDAADRYPNTEGTNTRGR